MRTGLCFIVLTIFSLTSGCGICLTKPTWEQKELPPAETRDMLSVLEARNHTLETFKGIGKIKFWDEGKSTTARVAWLGTASGELRIEVLNVAGRPVASIANDGKWLYLRSHMKRRFYRKQPAGHSLKEIIPIAVKSDDLISFLSGRVPITEYHSVSAVKNKTGYLLMLLTRWGTTRENIYLNEDKTDVSKIEFFNLTGSLIYRAEFGKTQETEGYNIPFYLELSDGKGNRIQLHVNRVWANIPVSRSNFVLSPIN